MIVHRMILMTADLSEIVAVVVATKIVKTGAKNERPVEKAEAVESSPTVQMLTS